MTFEHTERPAEGAAYRSADKGCGAAGNGTQRGRRDPDGTADASRDAA